MRSHVKFCPRLVLRLAAGVFFTGIGLGSILAPAAHAATRVCDARTFGAKPDGHTKDTRAIQAAIDSCARKGGGTVLLTGGVFVSGPLVLRSNIDLHLDRDATLLGSADHADYPRIRVMRFPGIQSLLSATNAHNISVTGEGTVDGNGESWWQIARAHKDHGIMGVGPLRPRLVVLDHCRHIRLEGPTFQNSPFWQIVPYYSDDIVIRNIKVLAPVRSPNTDAVDPFSSSNILIDHLYADVGDDDIAIKSGAINSPGPDAPSRNILLRDCTFVHGHGLSIGSEIAGGAQNIYAERIHFKDTDNGVRIKANRDRGNDVSNIVFRDLDMESVKIALIISEYYPKVLPDSTAQPEPVQRLTPHFHNITIQNLKAVNSTWAGAIVGLPESPVSNVTLTDVSIQATRGMTIGDATVTGRDVSITAAQGPAVTIAPDAKVTGIH